MQITADFGRILKFFKKIVKLFSTTSLARNYYDGFYFSIKVVWKEILKILQLLRSLSRVT